MDRPDTSISSAEREQHVGRILNDFLDRRARGEPVSEASLLEANPSLAPELRAHLVLLHDLGPPGNHIEDLITRGILACSSDPRYAATLGPYGVLRFLGRGGMGLVLQAHDASLGRTVALKVLRPDLAGDPAVLARFEREAKAAAALQHPNIVTVHTIGRRHGVPYIVMEYVAGASLAEMIRGPAREAVQKHERTNAALNPALTRHVFEQLLSALDAAHGAGLIHRDVKSSNILLDWRTSSNAHDTLADDPTGTALDAPARALAPAPSASPPLDPLAPRPLGPSTPQPLPLVKLADFGLARMRSSQTQVTVDGSVLGTPEYMSPEQARGAEVDHRTDLYSAGVVLYEMLTGQTPFKADTSTATIQRILNEPPRDPRKLTTNADPVLATIALKLMAKDPAQRFRSAAAAREAISKGRPVRSPANVGVRRRLAYGAMAGLVSLTVCVMAIRSDILTSTWPPIAHADIEPLSGSTVRVWYGDEATPRTVPESRFGVTLTSVATVASGDGRTQLVIGARAPMDDRGSGLLALERVGARRFVERWSLPLHEGNLLADQGSSFFFVRDVVAADFDGQPGQELAVLAGDLGRHPTCVALVDPRTATRSQVFWHAGQLANIMLLEDYFADGHHGLLAWGPFNADQPYSLPGQDHLARTQATSPHHLVPVVLILDPREMNGVWPVPQRNSAAAVAVPFACAYVDTWIEPGRFGADEQGVVISAGVNAFHIQRVSVHAGPSDSRSPRFDIALGGATVIVDRNLEYDGLILTDGAEIPDKAVWRSHWRPVIQPGRAASITP